MKAGISAPTRPELPASRELDPVHDFRFGVPLDGELAAQLRAELRAWESKGGADPAGRFGVGREALLRAAAGLRVKKSTARLIGMELEKLRKGGA
jgi:hypothetical protein